VFCLGSRFSQPLQSHPVSGTLYCTSLLQASRQPMSGCEQYIVNLAPMNANTVYVSEVWRSEADHESLLQVESVKALVLRARPLVETFESVSYSR